MHLKVRPGTRRLPLPVIVEEAPVGRCFLDRNRLHLSLNRYLAERDASTPLNCAWASRGAVYPAAPIPQAQGVAGEEVWI
jgi:hypothetical protein